MDNNGEGDIAEATAPPKISGPRDIKKRLAPLFYWFRCGNDPSAGSPTETLLRLLLPLSDKVYFYSHDRVKPDYGPLGSPDHSKSVGATGGVYKGQGRNQRGLMTRIY